MSDSPAYAPVRIDREAEYRRMVEAVNQLVPDPIIGLRIFRGARMLAGRRVQKDLNWYVAMLLYGVGSTYAHAICRRLGIDPDSRSASLIVGNAPLDTGSGDHGGGR